MARYFNFRKAKNSAEQPLATASTDEPRTETTTAIFVPRLANIKALDQGPAREEDREEILARMRKRNEQRRHDLINNTSNAKPEEASDTLTVPTTAGTPLSSPLRPSFEDVLAQWRHANAATAVPQSNAGSTVSAAELSSQSTPLMREASTLVVSQQPKAQREKSYTTHHSSSDSGYESRTPSHVPSEEDLRVGTTVGADLSADSYQSSSSSVYTDGDVKEDASSTKEERDGDQLTGESCEPADQMAREGDANMEPLNELSLIPQPDPQMSSADMTALPRYQPQLSPIMASPPRKLRASVQFPPPASQPPRIAALQGYKVNKKGKVLDEEGDVIGELVSGDILDCVRQKVDANGQVLDDRGKVVGTVRPVGEASEEEQKSEEMAEAGTNTNIDEEAGNVSPVSAQDSVFEVPMSAKQAGKQPAEQTSRLHSLSRRQSPTTTHPAIRGFEEPRIAPPRPKSILRRSLSEISTFSNFSSVSPAAPSLRQRRSELRESSEASQFATVPYTTTTAAAAPRSKSSSRAARTSLGPSPAAATPEISLPPTTSPGGEMTVPDFPTICTPETASPTRRSVERESNPFASKSSAAPVLPPLGRIMSPVPENKVALRRAGTGSMPAGGGGGMFAYKGEIPTADGLPIQRKLASASPFVPGNHLPMNHNPAPSAFNNPKLHALRGFSHQPNTPAIPPRSAARPPSLHAYPSFANIAPAAPIEEQQGTDKVDWATMYPAPAIPMGSNGVHGARSRPGSVRSNMTDGTRRSYFTHRGKEAVDDDEVEMKVEDGEVPESPKRAEIKQEEEKPVAAAEPEKKRRLFGRKK